MSANWRDRTSTTFACERRPATASQGMVVSNHPLASAAGSEMLSAGGTPIGMSGGLAKAGVRFGLR